MLLTVGTEDDLEWLVKDDKWAAQQKLNGKRISIRAGGGAVVGANRKGLECPIPKDVAVALRNVAGSFIIDGEMVSDVYYVFDILNCDENVTELPLSRRYKYLSTFGGLFSPNVKLVPLVTSGKATLVAKLREERREGVVFKRLDGLYVPGRIESIHDALAVKVKFWKEGSFLVEKFNEKNSISILAFDGEKQVHVGNVTVPEKYKKQIVTGGVVGVRYLYATDASILYQPNLNPDSNGHVMRDDIPASECVIGQLKYEGKD